MRGERENQKRSSGSSINSSNSSCGDFKQNTYGKDGLSRSRSIGIIVLMLALFIFQVSVFIYEKLQDIEVRHQQQSIQAEKFAQGDSIPQSKGVSQSGSIRHKSLFQFDPNTITADSLCLLGFSEKQSLSILKYREKGGRFRKKEDFSKMYVVSEQKYRELESYIFIENNTSGVAKNAAEKVTKKVMAKVEKNTQETELSKVQQKEAQEKEQEQQKEQQKQKEQVAELKERQMGEDWSKNKNPNPKKFTREPLIVDLNVADSATLVKLYGIGGFYARKIIEYRKRLGNFYASEQLMEVPGIDSARYAGFAKNVIVDPSDVKRFSLDTADKYFLIKHPYIGAYAARGILLMRSKFGAESCTLENLVKERVISAEIAEKLWFYVEE